LFELEHSFELEITGLLEKGIFEATQTLDNKTAQVITRKITTNALATIGATTGAAIGAIAIQPAISATLALPPAQLVVTPALQPAPTLVTTLATAPTIVLVPPATLSSNPSIARALPSSNQSSELSEPERSSEQEITGRLEKGTFKATKLADVLQGVRPFNSRFIDEIKSTGTDKPHQYEPD
jgi:hypothetical protein